MQQSKQLLVDLQNIGLQINKRVILENINLKVQRGEIVTLIGTIFFDINLTCPIQVVLAKLLQPSAITFW